MNIKKCLSPLMLCVMMSVSCLVGMEKKAQKLSDTLCHKISQGKLTNLESSAELGESGTIKQIFVRLKDEKSKSVESAQVTFNGIKDSYNGENKNTALRAVSFIRSDVADVLGGGHLSGDNLLVDGLNLGESALEAGDLLVVYNDEDDIEVIFVFTHMPHHASIKLHNKCGQEAYNFLNAFGEYSDGILKENTRIHGIEDRLRGIFCGVLKEGQLQTNNALEIVKKDCIEQLLNKDQLKRYLLLLQESNEIGREKNKRFINLQNFKKKNK